MSILFSASGVNIVLRGEMECPPTAERDVTCPSMYATCWIPWYAFFTILCLWDIPRPPNLIPSGLPLRDGVRVIALLYLAVPFCVDFVVCCAVRTWDSVCAVWTTALLDEVGHCHGHRVLARGAGEDQQRDRGREGKQAVHEGVRHVRERSQPAGVSQVYDHW